jgi:hypothetical protein
MNKMIPTDFKYELSDIKFIALYLKQDDKSYIIDLFKNNMNYYIVGNTINSIFLKYYLINILDINIDNSKPFSYNLELMDHNVNMVYLNDTNSIVIQKDGYIIEGIEENKSIIEDLKEKLE